MTEYQYRPVKARLLDRAQAVVWLDHPFLLVAARLLRRSVVRFGPSSGAPRPS